jgi:hypothetical protein
MMKSSRRAAAVAVACAAAGALALSVAPAGAQDPGSPALTVSPTSGPAGTVIAVSGGGCTETIQVYLAIGTSFPSSPADVAATTGTEASGAGDWQTSIAVPAGLDPAGTYSVTARCYISAGEQSQTKFTYGIVPFDVTGDSTTPSTVPPTVPPTVPGDPGDPGDPPVIDPDVVPMAPVAVPVVAEPDFTG